MGWIVLLLFVLLFVSIKAEAVLSLHDDTLLEVLFQAADLANRNDRKSLELAKEAVAQHPQHAEGRQLLAALLLKFENNGEAALHHFEEYFRLSGYNSISVVANYLEALRSMGQIEKARSLGQELQRLDLFLPSRDTTLFYANLAIVEANWAEHSETAIDYCHKVLQHDASYQRIWKLLIELEIGRGQFSVGESLARQAVQLFPQEYSMRYLLGMAVHHQNRLDEAVSNYLHALELNPHHFVIHANLAAAYQGLGKVKEALHYYEIAAPNLPGDAGLRNNFGALLGSIGRQAEEVLWLQAALEIDPHLVHALGNLAGYYQDDGKLDLARSYVSRAIEAILSRPTLHHPREQVAVLKLRKVLMTSPVALSWDSALSERLYLYRNASRVLEELLSDLQAGKAIAKIPLLSNLDRIHFYIQFRGINDYHLQRIISRIYELLIASVGHVAPRLLANNSLQHFLRHESRSLSEIMSPPVKESGAPSLSVVGFFHQRKRIGFISKFFGIFEPHGLLLDGVITHLPRFQFEIVCLCVARSDSKPVSPVFYKICDEVVEIGLVHEDAVRKLQSLVLDVLVFADVLGEPINHFLSHSRFAPIQLAFWGNPVTTGNGDMVDYFISADAMESPFRTRLHTGAHHAYAEQVVHLEGQGIHYYRHMPPEVVLQEVNLTQLIGSIRTFRKADFIGIEDSNAFVYFMPQSVFKIVPLFDLILVQILYATPDHVHIILTGGRREYWTKVYEERIRNQLHPAYQHRFHVIPRVSSEHFYNLIRISDVIIHPFPFDGSRTSADAIILKKPYITLPTEYLRGRMGYAFYRTMNIPELVAVNIVDYLDIALRLYYDKVFYASMVDKLVKSEDLLWEDMFVPYTWTRFLQRLLGFTNSKQYLTSAYSAHLHHNMNLNVGSRQSTASNGPSSNSEIESESSLRGTVMTYEEFLDYCELMQWNHHPINKTMELERTSLREENSQRFDEAYKRRIAETRFHLPNHIDGNWHLEESSFPILEDERHLLAQLYYRNHVNRRLRHHVNGDKDNSEDPIAGYYGLQGWNQEVQRGNRSLPWPRLFAFWKDYCSSIYHPDEYSANHSWKSVWDEGDYSKYCRAIHEDVLIDIQARKEMEGRGYEPGNHLLHIVDRHIGQQQTVQGETGPADSAQDIQFSALNYSVLVEEMVAYSARRSMKHKMSASSAEALLPNFHAFLADEDYESALREGQSVVRILQSENTSDRMTTALVLLELGFTAVQLGRYDEAYRYCSVVNIYEVEDSMAYTCLAIASLYQEDKTVFGPICIQSAILAYEDKLRTRYNTSLLDTLEPEVQQRFQLPTLVQRLSKRTGAHKKRRSVYFPGISLPSVEINLFSALKRYGSAEDCLVMWSSLLGLGRINPAFVKQSVHNYYKFLIFITWLSTIEWSAHSMQSVIVLQDILQTRGLWPFSLGRQQGKSEAELIKVIRHAQERGDHLLNIVLAAVTQASSARGHAMDRKIAQISSDVSLDVFNFIQWINRPYWKQVASSHEQGHELVLVVQYFKCQGRDRQGLVDLVLRKNLANDNISAIYLLTEELYDLTSFGPAVEKKVHQHVIKERLTFKQAFRFANEYLQGKLVMIGEG
eukprot:scaffold1016_cov175-Ochromonas_danica.AAC.8